MDLIDLHVHTTASDGSLGPAQVVAEAARMGLKALAVTDHDTVAGVKPAQVAGRGLRVEVVAGVELSVQWDRPGSMHLLGLFIDPDHPGLLRELEAITEGRNRRNLVIIERLNGLGLPVTVQELKALAGDGVAGRAHLARILADKGYAAGPDQAMEKYLKKGRPAYADRYRLDLAKACAVIHAAGGLAVLAHPLTLELEPLALSAVLGRFKEQGLDGLEVQWPGHDISYRAFLAQAARRLGLLATGGSDFHGDYKSDIRLGLGRGDLRVGADTLLALKKARGGRARKSPI